ncbi:hypothetical protein LAC03_11590 [Levilactobacillus acidifarinae]|nr:hypothetical protein LAC03_11590 [Levilactobacillus acidifarinae]
MNHARGTVTLSRSGDNAVKWERGDDFGRPRQANGKLGHEPWLNEKGSEAKSRTLFLFPNGWCRNVHPKVIQGSIWL